MKLLTTMMELQHSADCNPNVKGACSILGSVLISSHVLPCIWMKWMWWFFRYSMRWYEIVSHSFYLPTFPDPTKAATALVARRSMWGCNPSRVAVDWWNFWRETFDLFLEVCDISRLVHLPVSPVKIYHHLLPTTSYNQRDEREFANFSVNMNSNKKSKVFQHDAIRYAVVMLTDPT